MDITQSHVYRLARAGIVDADAPARATGSIDIEAAPEAVWDTLAHVENWPSIRSDISDARASSTPSAGSPFTWRAGGLPLSSAFALAERATRLTWASQAPGVAAVCVYAFEEIGSGRTRIRCEESMDAAAVAPDLDDAMLAERIRTWLEGIKAYAEGHAS